MAAVGDQRRLIILADDLIHNRRRHHHPDGDRARELGHHLPTPFRDKLPRRGQIGHAEEIGAQCQSILA